jgi:ABC-type bacteriocin/lantibiotic exporter with double-glycine peptidase domain
MQGMERATHILNVPLVAQKTDYSCGNTVLACVLQYHRVFVSADELEQVAGTEHTGTNHQNFVEAAHHYGLHATAKAGATLDELVSCIDRGLPVIAGWWSMEKRSKHYDAGWTLEQKRKRDCGHYSVLHGYTPKKLLFMDPQEGEDGKPVGYCAISDKKFLPVWYDTDGDNYDRVDRWYVLIHP